MRLRKDLGGTKYEETEIIKKQLERSGKQLEKKTTGIISLRPNARKML
jgi:hypothetical protein